MQASRFIPLKSFSPGARVLIDCLSAYPLFALLWFFGYILRQRLALGYWPQPDHPDPKGLGFTLHHASVIIAFGLVPIFVYVQIIFLTITSQLRSFALGRAAGLLILGTAACLCLVLFDPGHFVEWYFD